MRKIGELPLLGTTGQRLAAVGFTILGAAGTTVGLAASGSFDAAALKQPAPHEVVTTYPDEVFQIVGKLCVNGTVYSVVDNRVEALPNEGCSQNTSTVSNNTDVTVSNNNHH